MNETTLARRENGAITAALAEKALIVGDLSKLTPGERVKLYREVCDSLGLNPLTQPFAYLTLNNKLTLYAKRDATDQLRRIHNVSIVRLERERLDDVYVVTAHASTPDGRTDQAIGAVSLTNLKGEPLANAFMKAETKSKRRVTLSIVGLGWLDETEVGTIPDAHTVEVNMATGEIVDQAPTTAPAPPAGQIDLALMREQDRESRARAQQHPAGSIEALWIEWGEVVDEAVALGLARPSNPRQDAGVVSLQRFIDGLRARIAREQQAPIAEGAE